MPLVYTCSFDIDTKSEVFTEVKILAEASYDTTTLNGVTT